MATDPNWTPPDWMNAGMKFMLKTPLLHKAVSGNILLLTFTGRRSKERHSTPVTYYREGNTVTILTKKWRHWWKNFDICPDVDLLIAGQARHGQAQARLGDESVVPQLSRFLEHNWRDAKIYSVRIGPDGKPNTDDIRALAPNVVVVTVELDPP